MAKGLTDEEVEELLEAYEETGESKKAAAEETGRSRKTVRKYVDKYYELWQEGEITFGEEDEESPDDRPEPHPAGDGGTTTANSQPMTASPGDDIPSPGTGESFDDGGQGDSEQADPANDMSFSEAMGAESVDSGPDYGEMGYGEFIHHFFEGKGCNDTWVAKIAEYCRENERIPDDRTLEDWISEGASGVGSDMDAQIMAQSYAPKARKFMEAKQRQQRRRRPLGGGFHDGGGGRRGGIEDARFMSPDDYRQDPYDDRREPYDDFPRSDRRRQEDRRNGHGERRDQTDPEIEEMKTAMKRLYDQQQAVIDRLDGGNESESLSDSLREYAEIKKTIQEFENDGQDGMGEFANAVQRQMNELEARLEEERASGGGGGGGDMNVLADLATRDDADPEMVKMIAQGMGVANTDPEVEKEKWKFKREERKSQNRKEMIDSAFDNLGGLMETLSKSGVEAMLGGVGDDDSDGGGAAPTQPADAAPGGAGDAPGGQEPLSSTTRERFEELESEMGVETAQPVDGDGELSETFEEFAQGDEDGADDRGDN